MKAFRYERYGSPDVLRLEDVDEPVAGDGEVVVRVRAASINPYDWHFMRGEPYFMRLMTGLSPKMNVIGADLAGEVEAVGASVTRFGPGDEVFGDCGESSWGSLGEYVSVPEDWLDLRPSNLTLEQAAVVPLAGTTALQGIRDWGELRQGQRILIIGASGGVGTFAVQIAKAFGAEVTGVCSTRNIEMVRSIGADHVIDYTKEDFARSEQRYDVVFQLAGTLSPSRCRRLLTREGILVMSSGDGGRRLGPLGRMLGAMVSSPWVSQKIVTRVARKSKDDLRVLKDLIEAGKVSPVIDRTYAFAEAPEAIRYLETGRARGKVVITV